jgi:hypothetical protein
MFPAPANGRSFSEIVRNLARGFFEGVGQVAVLFRLTASGGKTSDQSRFDHAAVTRRITGLLETSGRGRSEAEGYPRPFETIVKTVVYSHFDFGTTTRPSSLNRHGILHGEIPDYATEANRS